ncbi:Aste57867_25162 [Aphanomyces stellatus]|uniref:Aste57867_25162 protein n=1 Tax=Aphanomyces stellatus TaxID=120398 RepID=A0A485LSG3_9STRA|nr:hypothetical protein As57867_025084 [Aphanomyces stellatus]VFU01791.1 Aste57867_25162 [Aphanomyces stellatus]
MPCLVLAAIFCLWIPTVVDGQNVSSPSLTNTTSCPRLRKSWDHYADAEKVTYIRALQVAMDQGLFQQFMAIHQDQLSNAQGHGTCVFLFWHRAFLVGFENMLRSLVDPSSPSSSSFACVTIPYYDYVQHNLDYVNQACSDIESCSAILRDLGGGATTTASRASPRIGGVSMAGFGCVSAAPVNHFCDSPSTSSCARCVPRGRWASTFFSPDVNFNRVKASVFAGPSIRQVTAAIELSPHNSVHSMLSGAMANKFVSPADPIFYSHHATIDLLHTIYDHCRVAPLGLSESARRADPRVFEGCVGGDGAPITGASTVMLQARGGTDEATMAFFDGVPLRFDELTDPTQLGPTNSYSYDIQGLLGSMYKLCERSGKGLPVEEEERQRRLQHVVGGVSTTKGRAFMAWRRDVFGQAQTQGIATDSEHEMEKMMVMLYQNCLPGDVVDYTPAFKAMWNVSGVAPAKRTLDAILDGSDPIRIANWTQLNQKYFGCAGDMPQTNKSMV